MKHIAVLVGIILLVTAVAAPAEDLSFGVVKLMTADGVAARLLPEDVSSLQSRPLAKTREDMERRFGKGFLTLMRVKAKVGAELIGEHDIVAVPCRLTVYEISKRTDGHRELRVVAAGYHSKPEKAVFRKRIERLEENVFLVTAEKVMSPNDLNSHLRFMEEQGNAIILKGFSSNWNLSALKFQMAAKAGTQNEREDVFEKDALWLIAQLKNPLWLASIRVENE
jgi:hypothetical protein